MIKLKSIKIFFLFVFIFFNNIGLPFGLQYTTLISPFLFFYNFRQYRRIYYLALAIFLALFAVHYYIGIDSYFDYFKSAALHFCVLILAITFHQLLKEKPGTVFETFDKAVYINFILTILAILLLGMGINIMWASASSSGALYSTLRLRLFTYEPSYYSLMLSPIFFFCYLKFEKNMSFKATIPLLLLLFSLALSFSFGVISLITFTIIFVKLMYRSKNKALLILGMLMFFILVGALYIYNPQFIFFTRLENVLEGNDVSGNARLFDSWILANQIVQHKSSYLFGIGWGQIHVVGHDIIQRYYNYSDSVEVGYDLPNILCGIFCFTGIVGLVSFLFLQIYFYRKTKTKNSTYRSYIFWFIFIYQFTGSYTSSVLHYALLIIAYTPSIDPYLESVVNKLKFKTNRSAFNRLRITSKIAGI